MHKYILIPDSFKGTLSARDFCAVAREAIGRADPGAQVLSIPLADGGERRPADRMPLHGPLWRHGAGVLRPAA